MLDELLNTKEFQELLEAIDQNKDYKFLKNGLTIDSKVKDNTHSIVINYANNEAEMAHKESKKFKDYLTTLDDDLFISVCDSIGQDKLKKLDELIQANSLEDVRYGINVFFTYFKRFLNNKISFYQKCLDNLPR